MALINSSEYAGLGGYSPGGDFGTREAGLFKIVYATGKKRAGEDVGKIQIVNSYDKEGKPDYILQNQDSIRFIMMFMKRLRQMQKKVNGKDKTVCFSFDDAEGSISSSGRKCPSGPDRKNGFCNDCKYQWVFAGALLDSKNKPVKIKNDKNEEVSVFIYFRNTGMKFVSAMDLMEKFAEKAAELPPLSDNAEYERSVITPRRFIIETTVGSKNSKEWGDITVFVYDPVVKLPDEQVKKILDQSEKYKDAFEKQFNVAKYISKGVANDNKNQEGFVPFEETTNVKEEPKPPETKQNSPVPAKEVSADELSSEIDLGF